ncbi:hypothetical protein Tco_0923352 [Tanacetum coccineum]|uniref:Uncharacterized protein n=1 Tax=Tanacetum coccineum TaxID=301880 RepID=A0ABQ5D1S1_9ASTR
MDKCKTGLGYNAVPPPYTRNFMPPKTIVVYPSLDDFVEVNESISESIVEKPTVETNEPKNARKENGALIIENWVSESKEEDVPRSKTVETFNKPSFTKINFVKSTEQVKSPRNTIIDKNRQNNTYPKGTRETGNQQIRPFNKITATNNSNFTKKINTVKGIRVNTARPKAVLSTVKGTKHVAIDLVSQLESGTSTSIFKYPALKQLAIKRGDEYGFVICTGFGWRKTFKSVRIERDQEDQFKKNLLTGFPAESIESF